MQPGAVITLHVSGGAVRAAIMVHDPRRRPGQTAVVNLDIRLELQTEIAPREAETWLQQAVAQVLGALNERADGRYRALIAAEEAEAANKRDTTRM